MGVIYPIHKRSDKAKVKSYRGIILLNTAYKIYASIHNDKLVAALEGKLDQEQMGFRKESGTIDAIYVINHVINRELGKKNKKVFTFFVDLKAAFNRLDKEEMCNMMVKKGVDKQLKERLAEIYSEIKNIMNI